MIKSLTLVAVLAGLILAGCGGDDGSEQASAPTEGTTEATAAPREDAPGAADGQQARPGDGGTGGAPRPGVTIRTGDSQFGQVLFGGNGQAIYYFDLEQGSRSECYGACAAAWPPVLTKGRPQAAGGIRRGLLGTTQRRGGATQVTYDGHPLYYYANEEPGEVRCHNVPGFGGLWLAVQPNGQAVPI